MLALAKGPLALARECKILAETRGQVTRAFKDNDVVAVAAYVGYRCMCVWDVCDYCRPNHANGILRMESFFTLVQQTVRAHQVTTYLPFLMILISVVHL